MAEPSAVVTDSIRDEIVYLHKRLSEMNGLIMTLNGAVSKMDMPVALLNKDAGYLGVKIEGIEKHVSNQVLNLERRMDTLEAGAKVFEREMNKRLEDIIRVQENQKSKLGMVSIVAGAIPALIGWFIPRPH